MGRTESCYSSPLEQTRLTQHVMRLDYVQADEGVVAVQGSQQ